MSDYDHLFKILLIGDSNVGKSAILVRFTDGTFSPKFTTTIGVDYKIRSLTMTHQEKQLVIKLHIWDTAGQEKFKTITRTYFRGAQGIMIVFDVTNRDSYNSVKTWLSDIATNGNMDVPKILIGAKCDLERGENGVSAAEGQQLADELNVSYLETSALTNQNIDKAFEQFSCEILKKQPDNGKKEDRKVITDILPSKKVKGCC